MSPSHIAAIQVYIPIWTIKDHGHFRAKHARKVVYIPIWTIKDMDTR